MACAGRENLDVGHVALYDQKEDADAAQEVAKLQSLGLDKRSTVVDLGAGTGQFSVVAAAQRCARVVAADISPVMLERLRTKVDSLGLSNVDVVHAGFLTYEHGGTLADFVYTRWALHHPPDFWKSIALTRMRAALRTGGFLRLSDIVYSFEPSDAAARIEAWCATLPVDAAEGQWVRADIEEHVRDEHSTYTWLLETMLERAGFEIESADQSPDGFFADYLARAV